MIYPLKGTAFARVAIAKQSAAVPLMPTIVGASMHRN